MMRFYFLIAVVLFITYSCTPVVDRNNENQMAYVPVYASLSGTGATSLEPATATSKPGKIYVYGNYIFQNDVNKGIHIIDNNDPRNPSKVAFLKIPYSTELAVKGYYLYANSVNDLLVINIQDPIHPVVEKTLEKAFPLINQSYPPVSNVYFVCPDASKGVVVDWELKQVKDPKCRR